MSGCIPNLSLQGSSCILFHDYVKSKEVNRGALLVPYNGDKSIMIDRFDCRGFLSDLQCHGGPFNEPVLSNEEWEIEQLCNHERYFDLYHSNNCNEFITDSKEKEETNENSDQVRYSAIGFDYDQSSSDNKSRIEPNDEKEIEDSSNDTLYILPPNLRLPTGMVTPYTEREAAIIEQTAKFVADKGPQLEILIKTKQANNPKFSFLNYENKLNPFYRHVTHLIKSAQYIPNKRHISHLVESTEDNNNDSQDNIPLPPIPLKIDISSTSYGKLIERLKMSSQGRKKSQFDANIFKNNTIINDDNNQASENHINTLKPTKSPTTSEMGSPFQSKCVDENQLISLFETQRSSSPATLELAEARHKMYEDLYQQYYPYYYQYYYEMYGSTESTDKLVEMTRNYAASSAASWIQSNMPDIPQTGNSTKTKEKEKPESVIQKMCEYVARNGIEFEEMMLSRNSERFAFLLPGHRLHYQYKKCLDKEINKINTTFYDGSPSGHHNRQDDDDNQPEQRIDAIFDSYELSPPHSSSSCPISFKMTSKQKNSSVVMNKSVAGTCTAGVGQDGVSKIDDLDDDFDFTDNLQFKAAPDGNFSSASSQTLKKNSGRISRFSPANPKNAIAMATHLKNDLQIQRKRKAAEFLASRMLQDKISKSNETATSF